MICETVNSLLSEFADERLDAATAWQVQTHLSECAACGRISRDLTTMRRLLQTLPPRQPSAQFDTVLAQRLAMTRKPPKTHKPPQKRTWRETLTALFPMPMLRPALAAGLALTVVAALVTFPIRSAPPVPVSAAIHSIDPTFVADCVAQRRRDAAGEPLADFSAQNLAGHLDNSPADSHGDTGAAEPTADASIF